MLTASCMRSIVTLLTFFRRSFHRSQHRSAAFALLRRRRDSLLLLFALFAALYGLRLWISSPLLAMTVPNSILYARVRAGFNYIILIPAFLFFISLGLPRRIERLVGYAMVGLGCVLALATFLFGDSAIYQRANSLSGNQRVYVLSHSLHGRQFRQA